MSTQVVPESVLRTFIKTYPDLFPTSDLTHLGSIPDPEFGWPIGLSRTNVKHLGGLSAVGINCASCRVVGVPPGELHKIDNTEVRQSFEPDIDLAVCAHAMLKLFHNTRAARHVPDQPPEKAPPFHDKRADLQFGMAKRHTDLTEKIRPPYDAGLAYAAAAT